MAGETRPVRVVGRLGAAEPFIGLIQTDDGYAVAVGSPEAGWQRDRTADAALRRAGLVCVAIAFFLESLADPPPELEATHADIADLVGSLAATAEPGDASALREALDAIDDGLAADAVVLLLQRLLPPDLDPMIALTELTIRISRGTVPD